MHWDKKDFTTQHCFKYFTSIGVGGSPAESLVRKWILNRSVETKAEGKAILEDLINSFLLEKVGRYQL